MAEEGSLGVDREARPCIVQLAERRTNVVGVGATLEGEGTLTDLRDHLVDLEYVRQPIFEPYPTSTGDRHDDGIDVGIIGALDAGGDVAS